MKPFVKSAYNLPSRKKYVQECQRNLDMTKAEAVEQYRRMRQAEVYVNDVYTVSVSRFTSQGLPFAHISIKRTDREPIHDWRDLQEIKNQLLGSDCEAIELYPAEARRVDTANQYHLWGCSDPEFRFPIGYQEREVWKESRGGCKQRPFDEAGS